MLCAMPPLVLMLIDSVFALAIHHDERAQRRASPGCSSTRVRAQLRGPQTEEPAPGGLHLRLELASVRNGEQLVESRELFIDLVEHRLLAAELALAELPLDRSGIARVIGELESWCYSLLPFKKKDEGEPAGEPEDEPEGEPEDVSVER